DGGDPPAAPRAGRAGLPAGHRARPRPSPEVADEHRVPHAGGQDDPRQGRRLGVAPSRSRHVALLLRATCRAAAARPAVTTAAAVTTGTPAGSRWLHGPAGGPARMARTAGSGSPREHDGDPATTT